jgi:hypothetical protein
MSTALDTTAQEIADRVATPERGFVEWIPLIMPIITQALQCLFHNDDVGPDEVKSRVRSMNAKNPDRLHRRMKRNAIAVARRRGERLTDTQADEIATAAIDACLNADSEFVAEAGRAAAAADGVEA